MSYFIRETVDREVTLERDFCHPLLHAEVEYWHNGVSQGTTRLGYRGFLLTQDRSTCVEIIPTGECVCAPGEPSERESKL